MQNYANVHVKDKEEKAEPKTTNGRVSRTKKIKKKKKDEKNK
jgi:hypothetical protein